MSFKRGDFVQLDGRLGVFVLAEDEAGVPENHLGVWFGDSIQPEVWTIPTEYFAAAPIPIIKH
jgi:hypothetical protein